MEKGGGEKKKRKRKKEKEKRKKKKKKRKTGVPTYYFTVSSKKGEDIEGGPSEADWMPIANSGQPDSELTTDGHQGGKSTLVLDCLFPVLKSGRHVCQPCHPSGCSEALGMNTLHIFSLHCLQKP